jgi:hypothetical protein
MTGFRPTVGPDNGIASQLNLEGGFKGTLTDAALRQLDVLHHDVKVVPHYLRRLHRREPVFLRRVLRIKNRQLFGLTVIFGCGSRV